MTYGNVAGPSGNVTDLYPTQTISAYGTAIARTSTAVYDFYTGLVTSATDVDNGITNATVYDALGRPVKAITASGDTTYESWTTTTYNDVDRYLVVKSDLETKGDGKKVATQFYDQLGRVRLSKTLEDPAQSATDETSGIKVETRYGYNDPTPSISGDPQNTLGTYVITSNPFRSAHSGDATGEETMGWTLSYSANTGRHSEVATFSGAGLPTAFGGSNTASTGKVQTDADANANTVTDQAGKLRRSITNALGQLIRVDEPDLSSSTGALGSVSSPNQPTAYTYDTLNNLLTVTQASSTTTQCGGASTCLQTRTFTYSSLSRLLTAANPESGTIGYVYDNNGNLTSKTDPRGVTTAYVYDALNRVTNRNYSVTGSPSNYQASPNVTYTYGTAAPKIGRLTKVSTGTGADTSATEYTSFDILGRVTASKQTTDGGDPGGYTTGYTYNLSGALDEETYPSTRVVKNVLNNDGTLDLVEATKNSSSGFFTYANSFTYNPAGAVTSMQLGNGKWESTVFNSRLQPTQIALAPVPNATDLQKILKLDYTYTTTGNADNNGNVLTQTIKVPTVGANPGFSALQTYTYDSLNRLKDATETESSTQTWRQAFIYDRYGNRNFDEANTTTLPKNCGTSPNFVVCSADKKIVDPAVNTSNNRLNTSDNYAFDNAGNTTADAKGRTFVYDGENKQVSVSDGTGTIGQYWYDGDGKRVKKYVPSTGETTVFVYDAAGKEIAEYSTIVANSTDAKVSYLTNDHLGSPRINTDQNGAIIARHDYMPFGEEIDGTGGRTVGLNYGDDTVRKQFTGYERDVESDLDFAEARYYNKNHGRFTSVDPLMASASVGNPQTLNRYAYVGNNPINLTDPSGMSPADFYNEDGKKIGTDGVTDGRNILVTDNDEAKKIEKTKGNYTATVNSGLELPSFALRQEIGVAAVA
ncbi:MAG: RHS repeat-associated core domain-containing protein, partial [Acidobacteriota bacterium]